MTFDACGDGRDERGFSYIDVLIAMAILLVGIMALTSALTLAVVRARDGEQQLRAKQVGVSTLESIFSARDVAAANFGWNSIGNKGSTSVPAGIFSTGFRQVTELAGADGIAGTTDDAEATSLNADTGELVPGVERQIVISDIVDPDRPTAKIKMRRIEVTIRYNVNGTRREENVATIITDSIFTGTL